jgi:hypothetical protein
MAYAETTFTQLKARLAQRVGGQGNFWSEAEQELAINEALNVWQLLVGEFQTSGVLLNNHMFDEIVELYDPSNGTVDIKVESNTSSANAIPLSLRRLATIVHTTTGSLYTYPKLIQLSIPDLDFGYTGWRTGNQDTPNYWAPYGINQVIFYPEPDRDIKVDYYRGDRLLNADTDYIQLGDEEIERILDYAVWNMNVKSGTEEAFGTTSPLKDMFLAAAELRNQKLRSLQLYKDFLGADLGEQQPFRAATPQGAARGEGKKPSEPGSQG